MSCLQELAKRRVTIRSISSEPISLDDVLYAVNVAKEAPSGANRQPWLFIIVTDDEIKREIRRRCEYVEKKFHESAPEWMKRWFGERNITWEKPFLTDAPVLLFVFANKKEPYPVQSVWLSIGYLLLALEERNLVTVTYTPSNNRWTNALLNVPDEFILQAILPIGKPKVGEEYKKQPRKPLEEIVFKEKFGKPIRL